MGFTTDLAQRVVATRLEDVDPAAVDVAMDIVVDTVGCMLEGVSERGTQIVREYARHQGEGPATIIGCNRGASPYMAAMVNGTSSAILDYDDGSWRVIGHPSGCILPAIFALGEEHRISGRRALEAYIIGYETMANLAKGTAPALYMSGRHNTGTLGVFGAAAACAKLLALSVEETQTAFGIAASCSAALRAGHGTMTKGLHSGNAASQGMMSAWLAQQGMTAQPDIFEHRHGFFRAFVNTGTCEPVDIATSWGQPWGFVEPDYGPGLKLIPSGTVSFCAAECAMHIANEHQPKLEDVERIVWRTTRGAIDVAPYLVPEDRNQALYCIPWVIATGLARGEIGLREFDPDVLADAALRSVCRQVEMEVHPDLADAGTADFSAGELVVRMKDGRRFSHMRRRPRAYPGGEPWTREQLLKKFRENALRGMPNSDPASMARMLFDLPDASDIREILVHFRPL